MLAKKTSKNQITLPQAIVRQIPDVEYFQVSLRNDEVILRPVVVSARGERRRILRARIKALGLTEKEVEKAVRWARRRSD
jgi:hypothetical protein